eukprot:m51a1_g893 hypothetical protein (261) ;mRNA; f:18131-19334
MIQTPQNQKLLTNVAVVRMKKCGNRFEIACYPNTVNQWRSGVIKDLGEVLQLQTVFTNVSKGVTAKKADLEEAFGTTSHDAACKIILEKGELQVSERERKVQQSSTHRDIATIVAEKCVNPETGRPLTFTMIEKAMQDAHYAINPRRTAKQQALDVIKILREKGLIQIERAPMDLRVTVPAEAAQVAHERLQPLATAFKTPAPGPAPEGEAAAPPVSMEFTIEPSNFRKVETTVRDLCGRRGKVEVLNVSQHAEGDAALE